MFEEHLTVVKLAGVMLTAYLLGAIPFASLAARSRGVDIFATGASTAGAANVFWHVGRRRGALVFAGDMAKGSAAISVAVLLDLPPGAAVMGHWMSVFTGFRGGDGMAALMGITVTLEPVLSILGIGAALLVLPALWRAPLRSSAALLTGFAVIVGASQHYQVDRGMVAGLTALAGLVLLHTLATKWRRLRRVNTPRREPLGEGTGQPDPEAPAEEHRQASGPVSGASRVFLRAPSFITQDRLSSSSASGRNWGARLTAASRWCRDRPRFPARE